jgi:hypothetical protein
MFPATGTDRGNVALLIGAPMRSVLTIIAAILWISGCTADTMRGYIGQDIRAVELANGPPSNQIDLGQGTRAFQWTRISTDTTPISAVTTTDKDKKGRKITQTMYTGGDTTVTNCNYTFLTAWDPQRQGWVVTGIRQPSLDCAIGDLN